MRNTIGTLQKIHVKNIRNVKNGTINFTDKGDKLSIVGIYGQNGSGKTAIVEVLDIFTRLSKGIALGDDYVHIINAESDHAFVELEYLFNSHNSDYLIKYQFELSNIYKDNRACLIVSQESLTYKMNEQKTRTILSFNRNHEAQFLTIPNKKTEIEKHLVDFTVTKRITESNNLSNASFIFNKDLESIFDHDYFVEQYNAIEFLKMVGSSTFIISNASQGEIYSGKSLKIPVAHYDGVHKISGNIDVPLKDTIKVDEFTKKVISTSLDQLNMVLVNMIKGLQVQLKIHDTIISDSNDDNIYEISLQSKRGNTILPISEESDGIKKIISFLHIFTKAYGNPNVTLVVDELDSGIFEYLLGEIVEIFADHAKGQLIFTSHNLRVLEVLSKTMVVFTTNDPENRYMTLKGIGQTNNLRDVYLRELYIGDDNLSFNGSSSYELRRALDRASKVSTDIEGML